MSIPKLCETQFRESEEGPKGGFLYKYCSIKTATKILQSGGVLLNSVDHFNDPFEGCATPMWVSDDELREQSKITNPNNWRDSYKNALARKNKYPHGFPPDAEEFYKQNMGISCFSETRDNLLMWSHYADNHAGVCIGFRHHVLKVCLPVIFYGMGITFRGMNKVRYSEKFPTWKTTFVGFDKYLYNTKPQCWEYEKEWRISALLGANKIITLPKRAFAQVIFGARSSKRDQDEIIHIVVANKYDSSGLAITQANIARAEYKLEFASFRP